MPIGMGYSPVQQSRQQVTDPAAAGLIMKLSEMLLGGGVFNRGMMKGNKVINSVDGELSAYVPKE